ncbi:MAG: hypothetical protein JW704_00590 [Anaerolineaceae bacterium]|nr:hypothetical protein [Anaerolineaceae bacterium]
MGLGNYGWDGADEYDNGGGGGKYTANERLYKFRFTVPFPAGTAKMPNLVPGRPATKRVLFLSGRPFCIYEHGLWNFSKSLDVIGGYTAICTEKNELVKGKPCPLCAKSGGDNYPYYIGFFPIIDMGQVQYGAGAGKIKLFHRQLEYQNKTIDMKFERVLLGAKRGSKDKPGVLKTLYVKMEQLRDKHGWEDLTGTVWDTTRGGEKDATVGNMWEFVERILPEDFEDYLVQHGADRDALQLEVPVFSDERTLDGVFDVDTKKYYESLCRLVGMGAPGGARDNSQGSRVAGAGFDDDDIPF